MIITDKFVYLHMPKTGGTFVEKVLGQLFSEESGLYIDTSTEQGRTLFPRADHHETFADIPEEHCSKKLLLSIRNPYDHYVSHYEFRWWRQQRNSIFDDSKVREIFPNYPELSFEEFLRAINNWHLRSFIDPWTTELFETADIGFLTWENVRYVFPDPVAVIEKFRGSEGGSYPSAMPDFCFISMDRLNQGLYDFLTSMGFEHERLDFILKMGRILPPEGGRDESKSWRAYYSPELRQFVRQKDRLVFSMFPDFDIC
jgi:hypothetical protein